MSEGVHQLLGRYLGGIVHDDEPGVGARALGVEALDARDVRDNVLDFPETSGTFEPAVREDPGAVQMKDRAMSQGVVLHACTAIARAGTCASESPAAAEPPIASICP